MGCGIKAWAEEQAEQEALEEEQRLAEELEVFSSIGYKDILDILKKIDSSFKSFEDSKNLTLSKENWDTLKRIRKQLDLLLC